MSVVQIDATESQPHVKYERLVAAAKLVPSAVTIVAHPCDEASLRGAAKPPPPALVAQLQQCEIGAARCLTGFAFCLSYRD